MQRGIGIGGIAQDEVSFGRQLWQQQERDLIVGVVSGRQFRRHGNPHGGHHRDQVQLPPVDPAVPARLGPVGLGINGGMGHDALFPMFFVPHAAVGPQDSAVNGDRPAICGPGVDAGDQTASQTADLRRQRVG